MKNIFGIILIYILILALLFGPMFYSNKKKVKKINEMLSNLKVGDKILTIGGIIGTISKIEDATVTLKLDANSTMQVYKSAISSIINE